MIRAAGYEVIINLAMPTSPNAIPDEQNLVNSLGMSYLHIPVDFDAPSVNDFEAFSQAMTDLDGKKVFVHCAANMRVSAFVFLYRVLFLGINNSEAERDLTAIWQPSPTWKKFIDEQLSQRLELRNCNKNEIPFEN